MLDHASLNIKLTEEEISILSCEQGEVLGKVMETVVRYGEALNAERLVEIEGPGHFVIPYSSPGIAPSIAMLEELVEAGLKTTFPFTLDPMGALDFENLNLKPEEEAALKEMYKVQNHYDALLLELGLRDKDAYTCNPYQPEVGNIPKAGTILAWSESACAIFVNSVFAARTNKNGAIMDLLSNIVGKTPFTGLLTDGGRKADWKIEIQTEQLPHPQLLGAFIGQTILSGIPYIVGLDRFLGKGITPETMDYLQEMGAAIATYGAIGLFHIDNITPEAMAHRGGALLPDHRSFSITEFELNEHRNSYPLMWSNNAVKPERCYIGCPHLSLTQLNWWARELEKELKAQKHDELEVKTFLFAAPQTLEKFKENTATYQKVLDMGINLSPACCETIFETGLAGGKPYITNSNKLRAYTTARYYTDEELVKILVNGEISGGRTDG